jgi:hypothetical protein
LLKGSHTNLDSSEQSERCRARAIPPGGEAVLKDDAAKEKDLASKNAIYWLAKMLVLHYERKISLAH